LVGAIVVERTRLKTAPIITTLLGVRAVIVGVSGTGKGTSISPAECGNLLSREASDENCCARVLHRDLELACKNGRMYRERDCDEDRNKRALSKGNE
jgi:hypothetical protein